MPSTESASGSEPPSWWTLPATGCEVGTLHEWTLIERAATLYPDRHVWIREHWQCVRCGLHAAETWEPTL